MSDHLTTEQIHRMGLTSLIDLVKTGMLTVIVSDEMISIEVSQNMPDEFKPLAGVPIHIGAAARKYQIANQTITRWVQRGLVRIMGYAGQKKLIDEAEIAWRASEYKKRGGGQGKQIYRTPKE